MRAELDFRAIGKRIRKQREYLRMTREGLAEKLGVSSKFCADIEYGVKGMSLSTLYNLSLILNLSTDYILKGYDDTNNSQDEEGRALRENIMLPLNSCTKPQLRRIEQMLRIFVAAVNEEEEDYKT